jgi:hypothetical protein
VARLLAPVNINSVRSEASFNEYSSLFDRQRAQFFLLAEGRSADDFIQAAPRVTVAADRFAAAFVLGMRNQDGYRTNDHQTLLAPGLLLQYQLAPNDTLSLETLQFEIKEGDTSIGFDPNANDPDFERDLESITQRIGWHHRFGPGSHLLSQFLYLHRELDLEDIDPTPNRPLIATADQNQRIRTTGFRGDLQHIWDTSWLSLVTGASVLEGEDRKKETTVFQFTFPFQLPISTEGTTPEESQRGYLYATWHLGERVDLTTGATYAHVRFSELTGGPFDDSDSEANELDPKVGLVARISARTTLRAAYFETLGGAGNADLESIEPTQVAGFNQLFDDPIAARARGAGVGLDQKFAKQTYLGVEGLWRELDWTLGSDPADTVLAFFPKAISELQASERSARAYIYQVLNRRTTATVEYTLLDRTDDTSELGDASTDKSLTHRIRIGLNYFHPSGWFAGAAGTWRHQELNDFEPASDGVQNGTQHFWIVDTTLGYQFPRRLGYVALGFNNLLDQTFHYLPVGIDQRFLPTFSMNMRLFVNF